MNRPRREKVSDKPPSGSAVTRLISAYGTRTTSSGTCQVLGASHRAPCSAAGHAPGGSCDPQPHAGSWSTAVRGRPGPAAFSPVLLLPEARSHTCPPQAQHPPSPAQLETSRCCVIFISFHNLPVPSVTIGCGDFPLQARVWQPVNGRAGR